MISALCAGSVTAFSLYGRAFERRLGYSQFQVNGVATAASAALYLPVPLLGYLCDRSGPAVPSLLAAVLFAAGYALAAAAFRLSAVSEAAAAAWYPLMVAGFACVGTATCAMYLSAVATCAKNFSGGRYRGLALAAPIAAFGLGGAFLGQVAGLFFVQRPVAGLRQPDLEGEVDVGQLFVFLSLALAAVGALGAAAMRVIGERDLIDQAAEELERSGLLEARPSISGSSGDSGGGGRVGYGTVSDNDDDDSSGTATKTRVLNAETRRFLLDRTAWLLGVCFLFMIGPGEAFINNLASVISALGPPDSPGRVATSPATHVAVMGISSTAARLLAGTLSDLLAPTPTTCHPQLGGGGGQTGRVRATCSVSRVTLLVAAAAVMSAGLATLASGVAQGRDDRLWIATALVGFGYGAVFSLTPIIIAVVWGVENFGTNWGLVATFPALGAAAWGLVYSTVYQHAATSEEPPLDSRLCLGAACYAPTFWAMAATVGVACFAVLRAKMDWVRDGVLV